MKTTKTHYQFYRNHIIKQVVEIAHDCAIDFTDKEIEAIIYNGYYLGSFDYYVINRIHSYLGKKEVATLKRMGF